MSLPVNNTESGENKNCFRVFAFLKAAANAAIIELPWVWGKNPTHDIYIVKARDYFMGYLDGLRKARYTLSITYQQLDFLSICNYNNDDVVTINGYNFKVNGNKLKFLLFDEK